MRDKAYNAAFKTSAIVLGVSGFLIPVFILYMPYLSVLMAVVFIFDLGFYVSLALFGKSEHDSYMAGKIDGMNLNDRLLECDDIIRSVGHRPIRPVWK